MYVVIIKLKKESQTNLTAKLQNSNQNSTFSWVSFNRALNNPAKELRFKAGLNLYIIFCDNDVRSIVSVELQLG